MDQKLELALKFTELANSAFDTFEQTPMFKIFRTLIAVKNKLNPLWLIEITGPFFYRFRKIIVEDRNPYFFIEHDYKDQMEDWLEISKGYGESVVIHFRDSIRKHIKKMIDKDPQRVEQTTLGLMSLYSRYLIVCKSTA